MSRDIMELRLFSDNCPGQNKNHLRVRFCAALVENERFRKIDRGHSFLPCDRDFAFKKTNLRFTRFTQQIIDILNFNSWWPTYYKKNCISEEWQYQFHHFVHDSAKPGVVKASEYINGCIFHSFHIAHAKIAQLPLPVQFPKSPAYKGPLPILETRPTPTFKMNKVLEGTKKTKEESQEEPDAVSEGARRTSSTNSVPSVFDYKPLDTLSDTMSTGPTPILPSKTKSATKFKQESDIRTPGPDEFVAEPDITRTHAKKEHIFDPTINNMIAAKRNQQWYQKPARLKYNNNVQTISPPQTEMLHREKVTDRQQMHTCKKGVEKIQRRAISTTEGPLGIKSATVLAVAKKLRPSKMIDCPEKEPKKPKEEQIRMSPDGKKCFLSPKVPECMPRPKHDCPPPPCVRADECLTVRPKKLPFIPDGPCVCVEPYVPHIAPPIKRLNLTSPEPPRVCPPPPCPQPRADDNMPHKPKQLKPYVAKPCACVEPPPMIDVPLKRLPPKCPPEMEEVCYPERVCPEEICVRADENLCVRPKRLPVLEPKDCPCIEPEPMKDVRLKRLDLRVPEQPRICPCVEDCPCPRADDNLKLKVKPLRKIVPGDCPCIEPEYKDVNFKRLECIEEPEPCDITDPCIQYPRADYGCWEYYTPPDPCEEKKKQAKKVKPRKIINFKPQQRCYRAEPKKSSFSVGVEKLKSTTWTRLQKNEVTPQQNRPMKNLVRSKVTVSPPKSNTIALLDKLNDFPTNTADNKIRFDGSKNSKLDVKKIMTPRLPTTKPAKARETNSSHRPITTTTPNSKKDDYKCSAKRDCAKKPKKCNKGPCPSLPTFNCPSGERRPGCRKKKVVDCCEKPPSPYPSFSELMEGQIEPFSEFSEWTCKRKEYGFYPKTTKEFEPLNTKKNKKCYSTLSFKVKDLLDTAPEDFETGVHILFKKGNRKRESIAECPSSKTANVRVIRNTGCHTVHSCPTTNIRNYSSTSNQSSRNYSYYGGEKDKKTSVRICRIQHEKPCKCTKEKCPKFDFPHCPPKTERECMVSSTLNYSELRKYS
nr:unnamed protein product [Callosobruchus analis]